MTQATGLTAGQRKVKADEAADLLAQVESIYSILRKDAQMTKGSVTKAFHDRAWDAIDTLGYALFSEGQKSAK